MTCLSIDPKFMMKSLWNYLSQYRSTNICKLQIRSRKGVRTKRIHLVIPKKNDSLSLKPTTPLKWMKCNNFSKPLLINYRTDFLWLASLIKGKFTVTENIIHFRLKYHIHFQPIQSSNAVCKCPKLPIPKSHSPSTRYKFKMSLKCSKPTLTCFS